MPWRLIFTIAGLVLGILAVTTTPVFGLSAVQESGLGVCSLAVAMLLP